MMIRFEKIIITKENEYLKLICLQDFINSISNNILILKIYEKNF